MRGSYRGFVVRVRIKEVVSFIVPSQYRNNSNGDGKGKEKKERITMVREEDPFYYQRHLTFKRRRLQERCLG